jgi:uncharacterized protein YecE (DUF72 family)
MTMIYVGTAGWSIPKAMAEHFPGDESHLVRYARVFSCMEINTSFYREHKRETYARWAGLTPRHFRFAVKIPQAITHENKLRRARKPLMAFLSTVSGLGRRLGTLLIQLPPSLSFEPRAAREFFTVLRECYDGPVAFEPRHATWFENRAAALMSSFRIARVAADPAIHPNAFQPGGYIPAGRQRPSVLYYRLHGSPRKYWSSYTGDFIARLATELTAHRGSSSAWCIFDNTASGAAIENALSLKRSIQS